MGQMLVNVIFTILNFIANLFLAPVIKAATALIPSLASFFNAFTTFIGYGLQYTGFFVKLLMIPTAPLTVLVGFFVGIFAFNLTIRVVGLAIAIYRWFKP